MAHRSGPRDSSTTSRPIASGRRKRSSEARTSDLIFSIPSLVAELSAVLPLLPGDVIFTGTPAGVGITSTPARFLEAGDVLETWIEGIGTIRNHCVDSSDS